MRLIRFALALLALTTAAFASHHKRSRPHNGQAGQFDYYLFVLSWSPEFCYSKPAAAECGQHTGFVVHGLWPQNSDGTYPSNCATNQPPPGNTSAADGIMPAEIIQHEWRQHGTCSGLSGNAYFALIRKLHDAIAIPDRLKAPASSVSWRPRELKQAFEAANRQLQDSDIAIQLRRNYLNEVQICMSKSMTPEPVACSNARNAGEGTFIVPPVR